MLMVFFTYVAHIGASVSDRDCFITKYKFVLVRLTTTLTENVKKCGFHGSCWLELFLVFTVMFVLTDKANVELFL